MGVLPAHMCLNHVSILVPTEARREESNGLELELQLVAALYVLGIEPETSGTIFLDSHLVTFFLSFFFNINNLSGKYYFMVLIFIFLVTNGSVCVY
jgi:hypothetical protein